MTERTSSLLILLGGLLLVLLLWYLSYRWVRHDTARRGLSPLRRKVWVAAAAALPLFGFALYLFDQLLKGYLTPPEPAEPEGPGRTTDVRRPGDFPAATYASESGVPAPRGVPSTGGAAGQQPGAAGPALAVEDRTPSTVAAFHQPVSGKFSLVVAQGPNKGLEKRLEALPLVIGRGPEVGLALENDLNVSRAHAEVYEWAGALRIRDMGSTHGTQVNGVPVNDQGLNPGDRILVGGTIIVLRKNPEGAYV